MNKLYFCDELNNVLSCFHNGIISCCSGQSGPVYYNEYKGQKIDWDNFKKIKQDAFAMLNEESIKNSPCKNCFYLREKKYEDKISQTYNMLNISHWTQCNCGCIYCARMQNSKGKITYKTEKSEYYDMLPLLKELYKHELLDRENLIACIQGGDISVLKEFEPLVKEFLKNGVKRFYILSNNIKYQPIIKKLIDMDMCSYTTSLDCASAEIYRKLKRVDKYNDSVSNLKKYAKSKNAGSITVKYIVVENINDNIQEIRNFIDLMYNIGIKNLEFMIDNKYVLFSNSQKQMPKHYGELYLFFKHYCEEKNINFSIWDKVEFILKNTF